MTADEFELLKQKLKMKFRRHPDKFAILVGGLYKMNEDGTRDYSKPTLAKWQRRFLFDNSRRIIVIASRQIGKCLHKDQEVLLSDGTRMRVEDMYKKGGEFRVVSVDERDWKFKVGRAVVHYNGEKPVYHLKTRFGRELYATDNHPIRTLYGWRELKDIEKGDIILVKRDDFTVGYDIVKSIELYGFDDTYDLTVEGYHNFVAGDIIVHNSTVVAIKALWKAWLWDNQKIVIVSDTGGKALRMLRVMIEMLQRGQNALVDLIKQDIVKLNWTGEIMFANGSRISSRTAGDKGDQLRGDTWNLAIVDEAQLVPNEAFAALEPALLNTNGQLIIVGTPPQQYRNTFFYKAYINSIEFGIVDLRKGKGDLGINIWSLHTTDPYDRPWLSKKEIDEFMERYRKEHTEGDYRREMLGQFYDDDTAFFLGKLVKECMKLSDIRASPVDGYEYVMGIDPAGLGTNKTAVSIIGYDPESAEEPMELHFFRTYLKTMPSEIVSFTVPLIKRWKVKAVIVDINGVGVGTYDALRRELSDMAVRVEGFKPFGKTRMDMYYTLRELIEEGKIVLVDNPDIMDSFLSFEYKVKANGDITVKKIPGKADIVDSIGMAAWYIRKKVFGGMGVRFVVDDDIIDKVNRYFSGDEKPWLGVPTIRF